MTALNLSDFHIRMTLGGKFFAGIFSFFIFIILSHPAWAGGPVQPSKGFSQEHPTLTGKLLVKFKPAFSQGLKSLQSKAPDSVGSQLEQRLAGLGVKFSKHFATLNITILQTADPNKPVEEIIDHLQNSGMVEYAELDGIVRTHLTPNDTQFGNMWNLDNTGQSGGTVDADIDAPEAWDIHTGNANNAVIVLDTGVDYGHEDLQANMWVNPGEIPANGIDDDNNGYVDDIHGIDVFNNDSDPMDDHGHGTHVSGTLGAVGNNGTGVVGVNHNIKIIGCKFIDQFGEGLISGAVECLNYAQDLKLSGVPILLSNNSWGCLESEVGCDSQALQDAIEMAGTQNMLFIAAAGNEFLNSDVLTHLPSGYDLDNIISVAATDRQDELAFFSNFGLNSVDLGAPGVEINSTLPGNLYSGNDPLWSGTSMATPHVAGAAALVWAKDPARTYDEVKRLLMFTSDPAFALEGITVSGGRLNVHNALSCTTGNASMRTQSPRQGFSASLGQVLTVSVILQDCGIVISGATVIATPNNADPAFALHDDGIAPDQAAGDGVYSAAWLPVTEGDITLDIQATAPDATVYNGAISGTVSSSSYLINDQAAFSWVDPRTSGTRTAIWHPNHDTTTDIIPIGFEFVFYGTTYSSVTVSTDGHLGFGGNKTAFNVPIPDGGGPAIIAPFWDDLMGSFFGAATDGVWYRVDGTSPNRTLTVAWINATQWPGLGEATFEVILYEGSNDIKMQYLDVVFEPLFGSSSDLGASATVGVQNQDGSLGAQYSFNTPSLSANLAILFSVPVVGGHSLTIVGGPSGSPDPVDSGGQVQLGVNAVDDQGHSLSYLWSDFCGSGDPVGSFNNPNIRDPIWTAPVTLTANETCTLSVTVSDGLPAPDGRSVTGSYMQTVTPPHTLSITTSPSGSPNPVASEGTVNVSVDALDSQGHSIGYSWSATCGSFANSAVQNPQWIAPLNNGTGPITCTLTVNADDGLGQSDTASYVQTVSQHTLQITDGPRANPAGPVASGGTIGLTVAALDSDPGHLLSYAWSDGCGGNFDSTTLREPNWTAPVTGSPLTCLIGVTVFDGSSLSVTGQYFQDVDGSGGADTTAPVITAPADVMVTSNVATFVNIGTATATDDTDPSPVITNDAPTGSIFPVGLTVVTWTATDASGNFASATQNVTVAADTTAPTPDPMTWASTPAATGSTSISMTAATATDASGVEYFFDCVSVGCNDSGWQAGPSYTDTGLNPSTTYTYRVQARDLSVNQNVTGWSSQASATTDSPPPIAGSIAVSPASGFDSSGPVGGPFTPATKVYTITNPGETAVDYRVSESASWLNVTPNRGTLEAGGSVLVTLSFPTRATKLKTGSYSVDVFFTNTTNGNGDASFPVNLSVGP